MSKAKDTEEHQRYLGRGCGGPDGGRCLEIWTNNKRSADVWMIRQGKRRQLPSLSCRNEP